MKNIGLPVIIEIGGIQTTLLERRLNRKQARQMRIYVYRPSKRLSFKWNPYACLPNNIIIDSFKRIPKVVPGPEITVWLFSEGEKRPARFQLELIHSGIRRLDDNKLMVLFDPANVRIKAARNKFPMVFLFEYNDSMLTLMNVKFSMK